jgi:hypothetical protein
MPVTHEVRGSKPLRGAKFEATPPGHFLARALGPATVASPKRSAQSADSMTRTMRSGVIAKGGSLLTERPLAMR